MANSASPPEPHSSNEMGPTAVMRPCKFHSLSLHFKRIVNRCQSLVTGPRLCSHGIPKMMSNPLIGRYIQINGYMQTLNFQRDTSKNPYTAQRSTIRHLHHHGIGGHGCLLQLLGEFFSHKVQGRATVD
ncbi:unnamed protein product [Linum trigynum]|uniref:Uncharacterized protein n=1 Tax=Linum trigynum TaxID=586398 RepID=A0AAV2FC81_9ROSI